LKVPRKSRGTFLIRKAARYPRGFNYKKDRAPCSVDAGWYVKNVPVFKTFILYVIKYKKSIEKLFLIVKWRKNLTLTKFFNFFRSHY